LTDSLLSSHSETDRCAAPPAGNLPFSLVAESPFLSLLFCFDIFFVFFSLSRLFFRLFLFSTDVLVLLTCFDVFSVWFDIGIILFFSNCFVLYGTVCSVFVFGILIFWDFLDV
jgi:hypothetical protein